MRVLVCGSRDWTFTGMVFTVLDGLLASHPSLHVIHGGARGADIAAQRWVEGGIKDGRTDVASTTVFANWDAFGKAAGPIRNQKMLSEEKPQLVIAFSEQPVTKGTQDMVDRAKKAGVPVWVVSHG